jgi:hypothetical protein
MPHEPAATLKQACVVLTSLSDSSGRFSFMRLTSVWMLSDENKRRHPHQTKDLASEHRLQALFLASTDPSICSPPSCTPPLPPAAA